MNNLQTQVITKIKRLRNEKGFSQVQMAEMLNIDKSVYSRIELGQMLSWSKYLEDILNIFKITPDKFFEDIGNKVINQHNYTGANGYVVETLHQENKEIYEKLIASKDEQIALLKATLNKK
jgi:transcriptional regulator with XRE-family HTH domain